MLLVPNEIRLVEHVVLGDLATDGGHEFLLVIAPLQVTEGTCSPVPPVAIGWLHPQQRPAPCRPLWLDAHLLSLYLCIDCMIPHGELLSCPGHAALLYASASASICSTCPPRGSRMLDDERTGMSTTELRPTEPGPTMSCVVEFLRGRRPRANPSPHVHVEPTGDPKDI